MYAKTLKSDIPASIVVFLVALPLCLGIALASGAPLFSGLVAGIVGGIVVGFVSKSHASVSGPAAGLAAVVLASITKLGSFELFLAAVFIAGFFQILMGIAKMGFISDYIPSNVIKGLLAAIGLLLILKQLPHAVGYDKDPADEYSFIQPDGQNTFSALLSALENFTPGAVVISLISLIIMLLWDKTPLKNIKFVPASLIVVIVGILLNLLFRQSFPNLALDSAHLVNIPPLDFSSVSNFIFLPTLEALSNINVWTVAVTVAIIASLETLLNIEAVDKMDPHKRQTPPNHELLAQGVGNIACGLFGGLPLTSVIVRSSVNVQSGSETKLSAILHGIFLLIGVVLLSSLMNLIPLASLAIILILTGYKLAKVSLFKSMFDKGWHQFVPFIVTILGIIFTDLLTGVLIGFAFSVFYILRNNYRSPFSKEEFNLHIGEVVKLELNNQVSFLNKASIKNMLWSVPNGSKVIIDATWADYIDDDVLEILQDFKSVRAPENNIQLNLVGLKDRYKLQDQIHFANVLDKSTQIKLDAAKILQYLKEGNERFTKGTTLEKYYHQQMNAVATQQNPMAVIVGCIDSRTTPEVLFDTGLGDILAIRIAGNIINKEIVESLELAVSKLGVKLIVVKGHSYCGAVSLALTDAHRHENTIYRRIGKAIQDMNITDTVAAGSDKELLNKVAMQNVRNSITDILSQSSYLAKKVADKEVGLVGAYHYLDSGVVDFIQTEGI